MTHSITDDLETIGESDHSVEVVRTHDTHEAVPLPGATPGERYPCALPRARPDERLTHGMRPEDFFGICAEEFDDEFMESLRAIRRGTLPTGQCS